MLIAAGILFPDRQVWLFPFPISIPMKLLVAGSIVIEFFLSLDAGGDNVSHVTHLGGALVGYLYLRRGCFSIVSGTIIWIGNAGARGANLKSTCATTKMSRRTIPMIAG